MRGRIHNSEPAVSYALDGRCWALMEVMSPWLELSLKEQPVETGRPLGSPLCLPTWIMWKEAGGRIMAEGQGLIGLSPDGKQLGGGTNQALLPPPFW